MTELYDIHCHILPGVDDGADTTETALAMLREAYAGGIRGMILTPHYHGGHCEADAALVRHKYEILLKEAEQLPDLRLYLGNEIYYYASVPEWIAEERVRSLADSDYVLLEFAPAVTARELKDAVQNMTGNGYYPILAHAERYLCLVKQPELVDGLIQMGAYIQVNTETILGETGFRSRHFVKRLIKKEQLHFVASDAHSMGHRRPNLGECCTYLCKHYGEEYTMRLLTENPRKLISNTYIDGE